MHIDNMADQDAQMLLDSAVAFSLNQHVKSNHITEVPTWIS